MKPFPRLYNGFGIIAQDVKMKDARISQTIMTDRDTSSLSGLPFCILGRYSKGLRTVVHGETARDKLPYEPT